MISVWKVWSEDTREPLEEATLWARLVAGGGVGVGTAAALLVAVEGVDVAAVLFELAGVEAEFFAVDPAGLAFLTFLLVVKVPTESVACIKALVPPVVVSCTACISMATDSGAKLKSGLAAKVAPMMASLGEITCSVSGSQ